MLWINPTRGLKAVAICQVNWGGCEGTFRGSPRCPVPPQAVLLCLLDLLPVLERAQHRQQQQPRAPSHSDEVLQLLLTHMEAEHRLALRRLYARSLPAFVQR